jgi:UDP-N-acetylmuramoyl-tripeptide--D-alanyl-D-alanine ligase
MAILAMEEDTQVMVLEMGMNHFREMAYLSQIAMPDIGVIVNIGTMHIEHLGSREGIRQAKLEILEGMADNATLLLNGDDDMLNPLNLEIAQKLAYFGMASACAPRAVDVHQAPGLLSFTVQSGEVSFPVEMALEGMHFVPDAMAAVAVGLELGVTPENIALGLWNFKNMAGRQEVYEKNGFTIINDCYNAGPESMAASLAVLGSKSGRRIAVLGDMLELGDCAPAEHRKLGVTAAKNADLIFVYGPHASYVLQGGGEKAHMFETHAAAAEALRAQAQKGDTILFKGSRGMRMERILEAFLKERE